MKRIALETLGCKANWTDTEELGASLRAAGFNVVRQDEAADAYVINTCAVTGVAEQQSRQALRKAKRLAPGACVIAVGCSGEIARDELMEATGVDAVFGTKDRNGVIAWLCSRWNIAAPAVRRLRR